MGFRVLGCHVDTKAFLLLKKMATSGQLPEDKVYSKAVLVSIKNQWFSSTEVGIKRRGPPERDPFSFGKLQVLLFSYSTWPLITCGFYHHRSIIWNFGQT